MLCRDTVRETRKKVLIFLDHFRGRKSDTPILVVVDRVVFEEKRDSKHDHFF